MNTSEVLNRAADLIEERGWRLGGMGRPNPDRPNGLLCLEGGIMAALGLTFLGAEEDFWSCPAYIAVASYLGLDQTKGLRGDDDYLPKEPLYRWNDNPERKAEEVIATLRACAVIEAARERAEVTA